MIMLTIKRPLHKGTEISRLLSLMIQTTRRRMSDAEYSNKVAGLNNLQHDAFDRVVQYTRARHQY